MIVVKLFVNNNVLTFDMTKIEYLCTCIGQTACANIGGHILEFNETNWKGEKKFQNKIKALLEKFGYIHVFYVGLTDIEKQDVWKWTNSGTIHKLCIISGRQ